MQEMLGLSVDQATPDHTYTYLFCDLMTDTVIAELPLSDVTYSTELNGIGTLRATIPYTDETAPLDPEAASQPGRTALYVDRDGVIVWGGIIWTRQPNGARSKEIQAAEFLSYYQHRYVKTTLSTDTSAILNTAYVPSGQRLYTDQKYIAWSLLTYANAQTGGNPKINVDALTAPAHGITRNVSYFGFERPEIYKSLTELASADDGFDFGIEVGWTSAANNQAPTRYRRVKTWYPHRGRTANESGLVFVKGGQGASILSYDWPEDGTASATEVSALGAGTGEAKVTAVVRDADRLASGWPLLETVTTYDGVIEQAQLNGLANAELTARGQAQVQPVFEVSADTDPAFGSYSVGDEALFIIDPEPTTPAGRSGVLRITGIENTAARGPERVRLTCAAV
ncbi:hypothetical protein OG508_28035 [Streptomyces sp. NBC_01108]|uniref:hypothetical protein n=1 Tax=Streptomyces sp. NBC_01108 TaxID=2903751 RepID=UPI003873793E|nr:hypothetical protein OG508_28035 [Streptomyces sp. NBC_01108]